MKRTSLMVTGALAGIAVWGGLCSLGCASFEQDLASDEMPDEPLEMRVNTCYPAYSASEMAALSNLVVGGEVLGYSEPFMIKPVDGADPRCFTEVYVAVNEVLKGDPLASEASATAAGGAEGKDARTVIAIRFVGGSTSTFKVTSDERPELEVGEEGLFFLYRVSDGSDYNTEGNHYYLVTGALSAWKKAGDTYKSPEGAELTEAAARSAACASLSASEKDGEAAFDVNLTNDGVRSASDILKTLERQKMAGELSDEEFEAEKERAAQAQQAFAEVMSSDEVKAYEQEIADLYKRQG